MRVHLSLQVVRYLRALGEQSAEVQKAIQSLRYTPYPDWAFVTKSRPDCYQFFVAGYWIVYKVDKSGTETVISIVAVEEN